MELKVYWAYSYSVRKLLQLILCTTCCIYVRHQTAIMSRCKLQQLGTWHLSPVFNQGSSNLLFLPGCYTGRYSVINFLSQYRPVL